MEIGVLNQSVDRAITGNKVIINNAVDQFNYCKKNLEAGDTCLKKTFLFVHNGEIETKVITSQHQENTASNKC